MSSPKTSELGFLHIRAVSLAVTDIERAKRFYGETLGLDPETASGIDGAFQIGEVAL